MFEFNVQDITWRLAEGKNCLVHCAGGNGRTGMVIAGIVKNIGVHGGALLMRSLMLSEWTVLTVFLNIVCHLNQDPIAWVRRVKTQYVETYEQGNEFSITY